MKLSGAGRVIKKKKIIYRPPTQFIKKVLSIRMNESYHICRLPSNSFYEKQQYGNGASKLLHNKL